MRQSEGEKGYALIIVLFVIVFIVIITTVFMRGSLSNVIQEKRADENNLVVVAAESGVKYYTWELKKLYDEDTFIKQFSSLEQKEIVRVIKAELVRRKNELINEPAKTLNNDDYSHKLISAEVNETPEGKDIVLTINGIVEGYLPESAEIQRKDKKIEFELKYRFPKVELSDSNAPPGSGGLPPSEGGILKMPLLKEPAKPATAVELIGIGKQGATCVSSGNKIEGKNCDVNSISESSYNINKSNVYINIGLNSWGKVILGNSFLNIRGDFTPAEAKIDDVELVVGGKVEAYNTVIINKSKIQANSYNNSGGTGFITNSQLNIKTDLVFQTANTENSIISTKSYKANGQADFIKTDLVVFANYNSGGASFKNSVLDIGGKVDTGGGLFYVEGSEVRIKGDAHTANGSTIKNSVLHIDGYFLHTSKPLDAEDSDVFVGGKVTATNGTSLDDVNMIVLGDYQSSTKFKLDDTNLNIGGILALGNGGELEESLLIAKQIKSSTTLKLDDSVVSTNYLTSDIMTMDDSKVCAIDFDVRKLTMDDDSKIYYSNSFKTSKESKYKSNDVIKLSPTEFEKKCGIESHTSPSNPVEPQEPGKIKWQPPVLENVIY